MASQARWIRELLDALDVERLAVVAHDESLREMFAAYSGKEGGLRLIRAAR
jgi:hypothetical protein